MKGNDGVVGVFGSCGCFVSLFIVKGFVIPAILVKVVPIGKKSLFVKQLNVTL